MRRDSLLFLLLAFVAQAGIAQEWSVEILDPSGAMGMGSVVKVDDKVLSDGWRYAIIVTADHVVDADKDIQIRFENGKSAKKCSVIGRNKKSDVALVWGKVPDGTNPVEVSDEYIEEGDEIRFVGRYRRAFRGGASPLCFQNEAWLDAVVIPGDSGGAVLLDGKLAGVISGGLLWAPNPPQRTWPTRTCNIKPIIDLLEEAEESGKWRGKSTTTSSKDVPFRSYKKGDLMEQGVRQVVIFSASWCNPCKNLKAELKRIQYKMDELGVDRVVVIDVDLHPKLAKANKVTMYPTSLIIDGGVGKARITGASANDVITALARIDREGKK